MKKVETNYGRLVSRFKRKLVFEGAVNSAVISLMISAVALFATSLIYHIMVIPQSLPVLCLVGAGAFILAFVISFVFFNYPGEKKISRRIDSIGLAERASTMLDFSDDNGLMAQLQRRDAERCIAGASSGKMKLVVFKAPMIACLVSILLAAFIMVLPHDTFSFAQDEINMDEDQEEIIKELIENLRDKVNNSQLDEEKKQQGNEIIDNLEKDLESTDSRLEQAGKIEEAKKELDKLFDSALSKNSIGKALKEYEMTRELGSAVEKADTEKVSQALDKLEELLKQNREKSKELSETIKSALMNSGVAPSDPLYSVFDKFANQLSELDKNDEEYDEKLKEIFDQAEEEINKQLEKQDSLEKDKEAIDKEMDKAKEELLGGQPQPPQSGGGSDPSEGGGKDGEDGKPGGDQPGGVPGTGKPGDLPGTGKGEQPGGEGDDEGGNPNGSNQGDDMTEGMFDPVSGEVSYGKVFAAYYAEYLKALEEGNVPPYLQEIIDKYYSTLN